MTRHGTTIAPALHWPPSGVNHSVTACLRRELARRRADAGLSLADVANRAHVHRGYAHHIEHGRRWPTQTVVRALDAALVADGALLAIWQAADRVPRVRTTSDDGRPTELLELAARAAASDASSATLDLLDLRVDQLARAYTRQPPAELLRNVRSRACQIGSLLDGRATLARRRRLLVAAECRTCRTVVAWGPGRGKDRSARRRALRDRGAAPPARHGLSRPRARAGAAGAAR